MQGQQLPQNAEPMRLQKFLARAGVASRRGAEELIVAGRVCVNGSVADELGVKVNAGVDEVTVDGHPVSLADESVYLMLHKPAGYVTTMSDPQGRPCVAQLVPVQSYPGLFAVGRLDMDTTGLLLFTTDGEMGQRLLHPKHHVPKTYRAKVYGVPSPQQLEQLRKGIQLDDGMTAPAEVELLKRQGNAASVRITIKEGRKRQVKRMFSAVHHKVLELHREKFGPLELGSLPEGQWRLLSAEETAALKEVTELC